MVPTFTCGFVPLEIFPSTSVFLQPLWLVNQLLLKFRNLLKVSVTLSGASVIFRKLHRVGRPTLCGGTQIRRIAKHLCQWNFSASTVLFPPVSHPCPGQYRGGVQVTHHITHVVFGCNNFDSFIIGSSNTGSASSAPFRKPIEPAILNAISLKNQHRGRTRRTRVTAISTIGKPATTPLSIASCMPLSIAGINSFGINPANNLVN